MHDDNHLTNVVWKFQSLINKLIVWNNLVYITFQVDKKWIKENTLLDLRISVWQSFCFNTHVYTHIIYVNNVCKYVVYDT